MRYDCVHDVYECVREQGFFHYRTLRTSTFSDAASGSGAPVNTTGSLNLTITVTADQSVLQYTCSVTSGVSMVTANVTIEILG